MRAAWVSLILSASFPVFGSESSVFISFRDGAIVHPSDLSFPLGDILSIESNDPECARRLESIRMKPAERNVAQALSRQDVLTAINRSGEAEDCAIRWKGLASLRLTVLGVPIDLEAITKQAKKNLELALSEQYQDIHLVPVAPSQRPSLVAPDTHFEILAPVIDRVSRRMVVDVAVNEPGRPVWRLPIWFSVSAFRMALLAPRDISINQDLSVVAIKQKMIDWAGLDGLLIPVDFKLKGYIANHSIPEGAFLKKGDIVRRPDVVSGDVVVLHYSVGTIMVEASVVAMQSGFIGDRILVRNDRSQGSLVGEIDAPGKVEVLQ